MRKTLIILIGLVVVAAGSSFGQLSWCGNSAMWVSNETTGADTWYNGSADWAGSDWENSDLGTISYGDSLFLGGELQSYDTSGDQAAMYYRINGGTYTAINLPYLEPAGSNDKWQQRPALGADIASGLAAGATYTVDIYFDAVDTDGSVTVYDNNGGNDYTGATFTIAAVPEPTTLALIGMGIASLVVAIRRRKA